MRAIGDALAAHLATGATTLCHCWRLTRGDGVVLGFTDHDCTIAFDGVDFAPAHGLDGGALTARLGGQVATSEVLGVLHAEAISEADIALGRYDGAVVETWRVNWQAPDERLLLRTDTIGEIVREDGIYRAELRGPTQALNQRHGRIYHALCDAQLGDTRCGVDLEAAAFRAEAIVVAVGDGFRVTVSGLDAFAAGWFAFGSARWASGARQGLTDRVRSHDSNGGETMLGFIERVGDWVQPGDALTVFAGCDRRHETCAAKFANTLNFRGFPHIPGNDYLLRHPRNGDALDGRPVRR